jgi:hypothetical protein
VVAGAVLIGLLVIGVDGVDGDPVVAPPRTPPPLPVLAVLRRLTRSYSAFSIDGVGEFR